MNMDCRTCRDHLSDLIDHLLPPQAEAAMRAHLAGCAPCRGELEAIEKTLAKLRASPREEPPAGLAAAILDRAGSLPAITAAEEALRADLIRARRRTRLAAAAAVLLAALAGALAATLSGSAGRVRDLETRLADLEGAHAMDNETVRKEREVLLAQLEGSRKAIEKAVGDGRAAAAEAAALREQAASFKTREAERDLLIAGLRKSVEQAAGRDREAAELRERTARAEKSAAEARREVAALRKELESTAAALAAARGAPGGEGRKPEDFAQETPRPRISFGPRGGLLEIRVAGPRDEVVPELFRIAWNEGDPDRAALALGALENLLGGGEAGPATAEGGESGGSWWGRQLSVLTDRAGITEPRRENPEGVADRAARLRELEARWNRDAGGR
jgi:hypothetical protein